jgi:hypothetical protein
MSNNGIITVVVTGHRPDKIDPEDKRYRFETQDMLRNFAHLTIESLSPIPSQFIIGMAQGWDMECASACVSLSIPYTCAIPFEGFESRWPEGAKKRYMKLLGWAKEVVMVSEGPHEIQKMMRRNCWMVDKISELGLSAEDYVLALYNGQGKGGTAHCVDYAERVRQVRVVNKWQEWLRFLGEERSK